MGKEFDRVRQIFEAASRVPAAEQAAYVVQAADGDSALAAKVMKLLATSKHAEQDIGRILDPIDNMEGRRVGAYRLIRVLAEGGMGMVYLAERADDQFEQKAAIKVLPPLSANSHLRERFGAERRILGKLQHRNIARLLDAGITDGNTPYIVMEYIEGKNISAHCDDRCLSLDERLDLFVVVLEAVRHAHSKLVIHRDIKPSNILIDADGDVKLLDFGIATVLRDQDSTDPTTTAVYREKPFTPAYAAPEQWLGQDCTVATDVYSLGVLLFELLTGTTPVRKKDIEARRINAHFEPPVQTMTEALSRMRETHPTLDDTLARQRATTVESLNKVVRGDLQSIVAKALEPAPGRRYETIDALLADIQRYRAGHIIEARPVTLGYRLQRWSQRNRVLIAIGSSYVVLSILIMAIAIGSAIRSARQAEQIAEARDTSLRVSDVLVSIFESADPDAPSAPDISAQDALRKGTERVSRQLEAQPHIQSRVLALVGSIYKKLGLHADAERALRRSLEALRQVPSESVNADIRERARIEIVTNLGDSILGQGRYDEARSVLQDAWDSAVIQYGRVDGRSLSALNGLFETFHHVQEMDAAMALAQQAVEIADALPDEEFRPRAIAYNNLAVAIFNTQSPREAIPAMEVALALQLTGLEPGHPQVNRVKVNLAAALVATNETERAKTLYEEIVASNIERGYGPNRTFALARFGLGVLLLNEGKSLEAETNIADSVRIGLLFKPESDYEILVQKLMLSIAQAGNEHYEEAYATLTAIEAAAGQFFPAHTISARIQSRLAALDLQRGDLETALTRVHAAELILRVAERVPPHHEAFTRAVSGRLMALDERQEEARQQLTYSVDVLTERYGEYSTVAEDAITWLRELQ